MDRKKLIYIGIVLIITVIASITYFSYAFFTNKQEFHGKLNIVAGTLDYRISSNDLTNNSITLQANETKEIEISIKSLNDISSKYELYYTTTNNDITIGYSSSTVDMPTGTLNANQTKKVKVIIKNKTESAATITFGVQGGFATKTLVLDSGNNLELYDESVVVTVYSAASDQIYYYDSNNNRVNVGTTDSAGKLENAIISDGITLYSNVAKDPNNLSNPYSKTFDDINGDVFLMPDGEVLYWYGYFNIINKTAIHAGYKYGRDYTNDGGCLSFQTNYMTCAVETTSMHEKTTTFTGSKVDTDTYTSIKTVVNNGSDNLYNYDYSTLASKKRYLTIYSGRYYNGAYRSVLILTSSLSTPLEAQTDITPLNYNFGFSATNIKMYAIWLE